MNIIATKPLLILAGLLLTSLAGNGAQWLRADAASANHAAELSKRDADHASAVAAAAEQRASAIGVVALMTAADDADIAARMNAAAARIEGAANNYRKAQHAKPLSADCRADAVRVQSINTARGHAE